MIRTRDYVDAGERAGELGFTLEGDFVLLPHNFASGKPSTLVYDRNEDTVRKVWEQAGLKVQTLQKPGAERPVQVQEALEWVAPTIYLAAKFVIEHPDVVVSAFGLLCDYLKGKAHGQKVKINVVTMETKSVKYTMVSYEGSPEGVKEIPNVLREIVDK